MVRIFLIGSHLNYNLEHYVKMAFESLGHQVTFFGYRDVLGLSASVIRMMITRSAKVRDFAKHIFLNNINKRLKNEVAKAEPDLILSIKGEAVLPETVEWFKRELGIKTALWYPDDPRYFTSLVKHIAPHYNRIFTASERAIKMYHEIGVKDVDYLPFACEPTVHRSLKLSKDDAKRLSTDVAFVGTWYPRRAKFIKALENKGFKVDIWGPYWKYFKHNSRIHGSVYGFEMIKIFNVSKIVLNVHDGGDLDFKANMRTFEVTGSGAFLLTDKPYGLEKLFNIGKEVACYNGESELLELVKYYLETDDERNETASRGQWKAYRAHTYEQRVRIITERTMTSRS